MKSLLEKLKSRTLTVDTHYRIGMRVVKTAAAVMICLLIALLMNSWDSIPVISVAAIVTIQATQGATLRIAVFRVLGTVIGGVIGMLTVIIGFFLPYYSDGLFVVVIPLMLLFNLYVCNVLNMQDSCIISCVVIIIVAAHITMDETISESLIFTLIRLRDTLIGVIVASLMNILPYYISGTLKKNQ